MRKNSYFQLLTSLLGCMCVLFLCHYFFSKASAPQIPENMTILDKVSNLQTNQSIKLFYEKKEESLGLLVNTKAYLINTVPYNEEERSKFFLSPTINMIESTSDKANIVLYFGLKSYGKQDAIYVAQMLQCDKKNITRLWTSRFTIDRIIIENDGTYLVTIPKYNISHELNFADKYLLDYFIHQENADTLGKFSEDGTLTLADAEEFYIGDFNQDRNKEFIINRPIYWDEEYSYVSSFYSIWGMNNGEPQLIKGFILDKVEISSKIISLLMKQDSIYEDDIFLQLSSYDYSLDEITLALRRLVEENILQVEDKIYSLSVN